MSVHQPHVSEFKKSEVESVKQLFSEYPVVGVLDLEGLPDAQYQKMKHALKEVARIKFTRKDFMEKAFAQLNLPGLDRVREHLRGVPALLFTREDPFRLYRKLERAKSNAPARAGQKAPNDIVIPAGPTPFTPGPMIGELGHLGIKTEVKEGKINIRDEKVIVREGEEIKPKVAELLVKLGIKPMRIGLNLVVTYQKGEVLTKDVLFVDEEVFMGKVRGAVAEAVNFSLNIGYVTVENVRLLLVKAYYEAKAVAERGNVTVGDGVVVGVAEVQESRGQASSLVAGEGAGRSASGVAPDEVRVVEEPVSAAGVAVQEAVLAEEVVEKQEGVRVQQVPVSVLSAPEASSVVSSIPQVSAVDAMIHQGVSVHGEVKVEVKAEVKQDEMVMAERLLKEIVDRNIKAQRTGEAARRDAVFVQREADIGKIINQLKDKKSRGEI